MLFHFAAVYFKRIVKFRMHYAVVISDWRYKGLSGTCPNPSTKRQHSRHCPSMHPTAEEAALAVASNLQNMHALFNSTLATGKSALPRREWVTHKRIRQVAQATQQPRPSSGCFGSKQHKPAPSQLELQESCVPEPTCVVCALFLA